MNTINITVPGRSSTKQFVSFCK